MKSNALSLVQILSGIFVHINGRRRIQICALLILMLLSGVAELISLSSVVPFLIVLTDPNVLWDYDLIKSLSLVIGINSPSQLLLPSIVCFALAAILSASIRLINIWLNGKIAASIGSDLSCESFRRTLYQPYQVHIHRNSSAVIAASTSQISLTVDALKAVLQFVTSGIISLALLLGLVYMDPLIAATAFLIFGIAYSLLGFTVNQELKSNSYSIAYETKQQLRILQEALGSIRDLILDGIQPLYIRHYRKADTTQRSLDAANTYLSSFPRYSLEALGMVLLALFGGILVLQKGSGTAVIPTLGTLALGAQRLLPALQQLYAAWATLKSCSGGMSAVLNMLNQPLPIIKSTATDICYSNSIILENISFNYSGQSESALINVNLEIFYGQCIGLIGPTGSGKSTLADIIMGLLPPTQGKLLIDGNDIYKTHDQSIVNGWRSNIAHVPQSIFLTDSSIAENIAFGVPKEEIDWERVRLAATNANISSFVESSNSGYDTLVGEGGSRLSGGQKQRIGIARALYKNAKVLVLDEATSALDTSTEDSVMNAINNLGNEYTVIIIAHRLSTVSRCDKVFDISNGRVSNIYYPIENPGTFT